MPQTVGYALEARGMDRSHYDLELEMSLDEMLDNISLYWLANTAASSARLCYESFATDFAMQRLDLLSP